MLLQLERSVIQSSTIQSMQDFDGDLPEFDVVVNAELYGDEVNESQYKIILNVAVDKKKEARKRSLTYKCEIEMVGIFKIDPKMEEETRNRMLMVNGSSILYGAAREHILSVTGRGPWPSLHIPTVSFLPKAGEPHAQQERKRGKKRA